MALNEACKILMRSISLLQTCATDQQMLSFSITGLSSSRSSSDNCFESFSKGCRNVLGKITAAANTGPAKHPRPASSRPASQNLLWKKGSNNSGVCSKFSGKIYRCIQVESSMRHFFYAHSKSDSLNMYNPLQRKAGLPAIIHN